RGPRRGYRLIRARTASSRVGGLAGAPLRLAAVLRGPAPPLAPGSIWTLWTLWTLTIVLSGVWRVTDEPEPRGAGPGPAAEERLPPGRRRRGSSSTMRGQFVVGSGRWSMNIDSRQCSMERPLRASC